MPETTSVSSQRTGSRNDDLGRRLRDARESRQMGLRELARLIGVSPSLISQIETGKTAPSVSTLTAIVNALDVPANEIFGMGRTLPVNGAPVRVPADSQRPRSSPVQREPDRLPLRLDSGVTWERLTPESDHDVDFLFVRYAPGGASTPSEALMRHNGSEYGYVVSGRLEVTIGFDVYELGPGDSIAFDSTQPHRLATIGDEPCEAIWFVLGRRHLARSTDAGMP